MVILERTHDITGARIKVSYLRAYDIDAQLLDAEITTTFPVVGGVRIAVPDEQEDKARRLLDEVEFVRTTENDEPSSED